MAAKVKEKTANKKLPGKADNLKYSDISKLSHEDLVKKINETKQELAVLKYNTKLGDVQNVHAYKYKRRYMARLLTALNNQHLTNVRGSK